MALPATHLRFAADMAASYPIHHLVPYISGTLYPDSRRFTGLPREKTHADLHLSREFPRNDFTHGWHVHCLCDHIQARIHTPMLPGISALREQSRWIRLAAAKMVQDQQDMKQIELDPLLDCLDYAEAPDGASIKAIKAYNRLIQDTYRGKDHISPDGYRALWTGVGVSQEMTECLVTEMQQILGNKTLTKLICSSYDRMLRSASTSSRSQDHP